MTIAVTDRVTFLYPTTDGPKQRVGIVTRVLGDAVEIKMQLGGYVTLPAADVTRCAKPAPPPLCAYMAPGTLIVITCGPSNVEVLAKFVARSRTGRGSIIQKWLPGAGRWSDDMSVPDENTVRGATHDDAMRVGFSGWARR
jgi:hypothetical protein